MKQLLAIITGALVLFNLGKKEEPKESIAKSIPLVDRLVSLNEFSPQPEVEETQSCPDGRCPLPQSTATQPIIQQQAIPLAVHEYTSAPVVTYSAPVVTYSHPVVTYSAPIVSRPTVVYHERRFPNYRFGQPVRNIVRAQPVRTFFRRMGCR